MKKHTGENLHHCTQCDKAFVLKIHLTEHIRTHTGERPYSCSQCGKGFRKKGDLKYHLVTHTVEKPHQCSQCDKAFGHKSFLRKHMKMRRNHINAACVKKLLQIKVFLHITLEYTLGKNHTHVANVTKHMQ